MGTRNTDGDANDSQTVKHTIISKEEATDTLVPSIVDQIGAKNILVNAKSAVHPKQKREEYFTNNGETDRSSALATIENLKDQLKYLKNYKRQFDELLKNSDLNLTGK